MAYQAALIDRAVARAALQYGVSYYSQWRTHGSSVFNPRGVVCHHDASNRHSGNNGALNMIIHGGRDFPGPYGNFQLARNGLLWVVSAGRANHAGKGSWQGLRYNSSVFGIEAANDGIGEPWSAAMLDTYYRLVNALLAEMGQPTIMTCGHKEWTSRKIDPAFRSPSISMTQFRQRVSSAEGGVVVAPDKEEIMYRFMKAAGDTRIFAVSDSGYGWHLTPSQFKELQNHIVTADNRVWEVSPGLLQKLTSGAYEAR